MRGQKRYHSYTPSSPARPGCPHCIKHPHTHRRLSCPWLMHALRKTRLEEGKNEEVPFCQPACRQVFVSCILSSTCVHLEWVTEWVRNRTRELNFIKLSWRFKKQSPTPTKNFKKSQNTSSTNSSGKCISQKKMIFFLKKLPTRQQENEISWALGEKKRKRIALNCNAEVVSQSRVYILQDGTTARLSGDKWLPENL